MEEFWIEINLEKLKVKMEVFVSLEKVINHCVGGMRTHTEKALNRGHSVGERAFLEACKTESTSVGSLIENLFFEIMSFPTRRSRPAVPGVRSGHFLGERERPRHDRV